MDALLKILEEDALTPPENIAKRLGRTVDEVKAHIAELEQEKVILGYKAIIDDEKAQRTHVKAVIEVRITPERGGGYNRLATRIAKFPEVISCYLMSGTYDLLVMVEADDIRAVSAFIYEKVSPIEGVLSTVTHFLLRPYKEARVMLDVEDEVERLAVSP